MPKPTFTPGVTVAAGALEIGDTIYARQNHITKQPTTPVEVVRLVPSVKTLGLVRIVVQSPYQRQSPWTIGTSGYVSVDKAFTRAVPVEA